MTSEVEKLKQEVSVLRQRVAHLEELLWICEQGDSDVYHSVTEELRKAIGLPPQEYIDLGFGIR